MKLLEYLHLLTGWWGRRREARQEREAAELARLTRHLHKLRPTREEINRPRILPTIKPATTLSKEQ